MTGRSLSPSGSAGGLKVGGAGEPLYVIRTEPEARRVVVGPRAALARREIAVGGLNWLGGAEAPLSPGRGAGKDPLDAPARRGNPPRCPGRNRHGRARGAGARRRTGTGLRSL